MNTMRTFRHKVKTALATLATVFLMIAVGCTEENTIEKLGIRPTNYSFDVVKNGIDLETEHKKYSKWCNAGRIETAGA